MPTLRRSFVASCIASAFVAACGGGGGADGSSNGSGAGGGTQPAPLTLSGTAATGKAIAGKQVQAKCSTGSGSTTSNADGSYRIEIAGGSAPCVIAVDAGNATTLHSVVEGSGSGSVTANVTPLSELVVARLNGGSAAALFADFGAAAQARVTATGLADALGVVRSALQGTVELSGVDPLKDALVAATASAAGNALDGKLDALQAALAAAQTTLAEVAAAVAVNGPVAAPVRTMLRPAAAGCAGLRSGRYVALSPVSNDTSAPLSKTVEIDATTLVAAIQGTLNTLTLADDGGCTYSEPDDGQSSTKWLVAKSGLMVSRETITSGANAGQVFVNAVLVPQQEIPISELTGTWNFIDHFRETTTSSLVPEHGTVTIDVAGTITAMTGCDTAQTCTTVTPDNDTFSVHPDGGLGVGGDAVNPPSRAFAFKTPDGQLSMFLKYSAGRGMMVLSKQASLPLPAVASVANVWDFTVAGSGLASALTTSTYTITAIDANAHTYTRIRAADNRIDSFEIDDPRTGMRSRATNTCTANGAAIACSGIVVLPLPGTGVTVYSAVAPQSFFGISIARP